MQNSQQTRMLYVITKSVWGGAQRYVFDLATNVPKDQFETAVAVGGNGLLMQQLKENHIVTHDVAHFQKSINPLKDVAVFFELLSIYKKFQPDIIHTNSSKAGGIASAAAFVYRVLTGRPARCVFTVHGWAFLETWRPMWQQFLMRLFSILTVFLHDHIIVISKRDQEAALTYNIAPTSKVTFIHNGIGDLAFRPRADAQKELLGKEYPLVIGTVAEWTKNKGLEHLIAAMPAVLEKFPETILCLIGWGEESEKLKMQSVKLEIQHAVIFQSKTPADGYLKAFDIFVLPSLKEGLPYTLLEAGLAGLPVVATRVGGIPEIIENGTSGILVSPASSEELVGAITKLCRDPALRDTMGIENKRQVETKFSRANMLKQTKMVYQKML